MNTRLKCLLLDDELPGLTYLKMLCEQIEELEVLKAFNNPLALMNELPNFSVDLLIIDIELPIINGIELAKSIKGIPIIFTTAYSHYAAEAFDVDAVDFVRKPLTIDRLKDAVLKAQRRLNSDQPKKLHKQFNTDKGKSLIFFDQIAYITTSEIDSRDKHVLLDNGFELTIKNITFTSLLNELPNMDFCRINKFEVVAIKHIKLLSGDVVVTNIELKNGKMLTLNLSETYKDEFLVKVTI